MSAAEGLESTVERRHVWVAPAGLALALVAALATAGPVQAQGMAWLRETQGLSRTDIDLHWETLQGACEEQPDGETRSWSNDRTGHRGSVTPLRSVEDEGRRCRDVLTTITAARTVRSRHRMCRMEDGVWKFLD